MDSRIKERLVGGTVLLILAGLLLWLLTQNPDAPEPVLDMTMPPAPDVERRAPEPVVSEQAVNQGLQRIEADRQEIVSAVTESEPEPGPEPESEPPTPPVDAPSGAETAAQTDAAAEQSATDQDDLQGLAGFAVQVASLSALDSAEALKEQLQQVGYRVFVEHHTDDNTSRTFYRVLLGPELRREDAEALLAQVVAEDSVNISSGLIRRFVP